MGMEVVVMVMIKDHNNRPQQTAPQPKVESEPPMNGFDKYEKLRFPFKDVLVPNLSTSPT